LIISVFFDFSGRRMGLVFMVWRVVTPGHHAQDVAAPIEELAGAGGDVVL
jgi:hypothetical protein